MSNMTIEILIKWYEVGLLINLDLMTQIKLAGAYEYASKIMIADANKEVKEFNEEIVSIMCPCLYKITNNNPNIDLSDEFVLEMLHKLSDFIKSKEYSDGMTSNNYVNAIDMEAELLHLFVETNYGK